MSFKTTLLVALMMPGLAVLAACDRTPDKDDTATPPAAAEPAPAPASPAVAAPADTMTAAQMASMPEMSFADMDKNHDGKLTKDELAPTDMLAQHFSVADADGNGALSEAEVTKHRADMAAAPAK
jgi:Ca2+-binding EF-hand superfamily protein